MGYLRRVAQLEGAMGRRAVFACFSVGLSAGVILDLGRDYSGSEPVYWR